MDYIEIYSAINKSLISVAESITALKPVEDKKVEPYVRLQENPFVLTEDIARVSQVVTAHELNEYVNKFYSISLRDKTSSWLQYLLRIDKEAE